MLLVEIEGYGPPFNLNLLPNPGGEGTGKEPMASGSYIPFSDPGGFDVPDLVLTLDEVIALVVVVNSTMEVTLPDDTRNAFAHICTTLAGTAGDAGSGSAMWGGPVPVIDDEAFATVERALASRSLIEFTYHRPGPNPVESVTRVEAFPVEVQAAYDPLLLIVTSIGPYSYRLDRIGGVHKGRKAGRTGAATAHATTVNEARPWSPRDQRMAVAADPSGQWIGEALPDTSMGRSKGDGGGYDVPFVSMPDESLASSLAQLGPAARAVEPRETVMRLTKRFRGLAGAARVARPTRGSALSSTQ